MYISNYLQIRGTKDTSCLSKWEPSCEYFSLHEENSSLFLSFSDLQLFKLKGYKVMTFPNHIFPLKWDISGSNDNKTYQIISYQKDPLCSGSEVQVNSYGLSCSAGVFKEYNVVTNKYYRYFRFRQLGKNSCIEIANICAYYSLLFEYHIYFD